MDMDAAAKREVGRALAALRRRVVGACVVCGTRITGAAHRRYCSDVCRARAYRQRKRDGQPGKGKEEQA